MFDRRQFLTAAGFSLVGSGPNQAVHAADRKFIEILKTQVIAENGFYEGPWEVGNNGPEVGERRIFIAYMDNSGQRNDPAWE
jgi:hypothetical protein